MFTPKPSIPPSVARPWPHPVFANQWPSGTAYVTVASKVAEGLYTAKWPNGKIISCVVERNQFLRPQDSRIHRVQPPVDATPIVPTAIEPTPIDALGESSSTPQVSTHKSLVWVENGIPLTMILPKKFLSQEKVWWERWRMPAAIVLVKCSLYTQYTQSNASVFYHCQWQKTIDFSLS